MPPARCTEVPMSQQEQFNYVRTHEYISGSAKSHLSVTPQTIYESVGNQEVIRFSSHDFKYGDFVCPGFFEKVNQENFVHEVRPHEWNYEMRRQAQVIMPFLYLGPLACLKDRAWLEREGFTLLLAIRNKRSAQARLVSGEKIGVELGIEADSVDVMDNQELISAFPYAIRRINDHLVTQTSREKKVLVFCESGNERSASVVIAYMMVMLNLDTASALHVIQQRRFCICIEDQHRQLLASFESILTAKRDVELAKRAAIGNSNLAMPPMVVSRKRSVADRFDNEAMRDDIMDMDMDDDWTTDRKPVAPFQDRLH